MEGLTDLRVFALDEGTPLLGTQPLDLRPFAVGEEVPTVALFDAPSVVERLSGGHWGTLDDPDEVWGQEAVPVAAAETAEWLTAFREALDRPLEAAGQVYALARQAGQSVSEAARKAGVPLRGMAVPAEAQVPELVPRYLADQLEGLAKDKDWPKRAVRKFLTWMRRAPAQQTVVMTVDQIQAHGPPAEWPGVEAWYRIGDQLKGIAARVRAAEGLALVKSTPAAAVAAFKRRVRRATPPLQRLRNWAERVVAQLARTARQIAMSVQLGSRAVSTGAEGLVTGVLLAGGVLTGLWLGDRLVPDVVRDTPEEGVLTVVSGALGGVAGFQVGRLMVRRQRRRQRWLMQRQRQRQRLRQQQV